MNKEIIIIGAGIIGCSTAYHLSRAGLKDILLLEKNGAPGEGSTGKSAGGIRVRSSYGDEYQTGTLVNASGPYAGKIAELLGYEIPVVPYRRQLFMTKPQQKLPTGIPLTIDLDAPFYFKPETGGILMSIAEVQTCRNFDLSLDNSSLPVLARRASHRVHLFNDAKIIHGWAGLRTLTPDHPPIIGSPEHIPGFYQIVGFSRHGISFAPSVGKLAAESIVQGVQNQDLVPFGPERFSGMGKLEDFSAF